jgi:hypothetical protein
MEMVNIQEITPDQWAALVRFLGKYATERPFAPVPLRRVRAIVHRILALRTEAGAYSDKINSCGIRLNNGLDPKTFEVIDQESFGIAISRAVEAVENKVKLKSQAGSNGESSSEVEVLTPLATGQLRAINRKLGPKKAPLPDPKSLYPQPARSPLPAQPQKESSGCQQKPAGVSRYTNCS